MLKNNIEKRNYAARESSKEISKFVAAFKRSEELRHSHAATNKYHQANIEKKKEKKKTLPLELP